MQFSVKLIEARITTRAAMKAAPTKSVLDGNLTVSQTAELANEMLNEAQRSRGGSVVREDESRYLATIQRLDTPATWSGEVIGPPALYPLTTVNVLPADSRILEGRGVLKPENSRHAGSRAGAVIKFSHASAGLVKRTSALWC